MLQMLLAARKRLGLTQQEMAEKLGISRNYLALIETGKRRVPPHVADQLVTMRQDIVTSCENQSIAEPADLAPNNSYLARIADLERQLERANETIASQARTIEAMQGRAIAVPASGARSGVTASKQAERRGA